MMAIFTNFYFFPLFQAALLAVLAFALVRDFRSPIPEAIARGPESMNVLEKVTGLVIAAIITVINKSVFDEDPIWGHYSAVFNLADLCSVIYLCYFSPWGRNRIIALYVRSKKG